MFYAVIYYVYVIFLSLAPWIISKGLSARQAEALVKQRAGTDTTSGVSDISVTVKTGPEKPAAILALEARAAEQLGLAMTIDWDASKTRGKLVFACEDFAQITFILEQLGLE